MGKFGKAAALFMICCLTLILSFGCGKDLPESGDTQKPSGPDPVKEGVVDFVLELEEDKEEIRILQLTDIQIIDGLQDRAKRLSDSQHAYYAPDRMEDIAFKYMRQSVKRADPDLIVLTGDNIYGEFDNNGTSLQALVAEMESYNIPWTAVFGNHDNESFKEIKWQCRQYAKAPHCMFKRGKFHEVEGNGNFTIGVTHGDKLIEVLYLIDTHGCAATPNTAEGVYPGPDFYPGQRKWVKTQGEKIKEFNGGKYVKSLAFFHFPVRAFGDAMTKYGYEFNMAEWKFNGFEIGENDRGDFGKMHEDCSYIDNEYVFTNLFKSIGGEGFFFGHCHINHCSVVHEGMRYTFGLKASIYDYCNEDEIGGTLIKAGGEKGLQVEHIFYDPLYKG